jgi:hypothetical protein
LKRDTEAAELRPELQSSSSRARVPGQRSKPALVMAALAIAALAVGFSLWRWSLGARPGESPRKLLQAARGDRFLQVQWAPDGGRIAYLRSHTDSDRSETAIETLPVAGGLSSTLCRIIYTMQEPPPNDRDMNLWETSDCPSHAKISGAPRRITNWAGLSLLDLSVQHRRQTPGFR